MPVFQLDYLAYCLAHMTISMPCVSGAHVPGQTTLAFHLVIIGSSQPKKSTHQLVSKPKTLQLPAGLSEWVSKVMGYQTIYPSGKV